MADKQNFTDKFNDTEHVNNFTKKVVNNREDAKATYGYYSKVLNKPFDTLSELKAAEEADAAKKRAFEAAKTSRKEEAEQVETALTAYRNAAKKAEVELAAAKEENVKALDELRVAYKAKVKAIEAKVEEARKAYVSKLGAFTKKYGGFHTTVKDDDSVLTISVDTADTLMDDFLKLFQSVFSW